MSGEEWVEYMQESDEKSKEKVCSAFDSIKRQIERINDELERENGRPMEVIGISKLINDDDVKTIHNMRCFLTTGQLEYLQKHHIID